MLSENLRKKEPLRRLIIVLTLWALLLPSAAAEELIMSGNYPSLAGAYSRIILVPHDALPSPCTPGTIYVNENGSLQYCNPTQKGLWSSIGVRMERGSVKNLQKGLSPVTFEFPFSDLPLVQIYEEVNVKTPDGVKKSIVSASNVMMVDLSKEGFKINNYAQIDEIDIYWVAVGN